MREAGTSGDYLLDPNAAPDATENDIVELEKVLAGAKYEEPLDWNRVEAVAERENKRRWRRRVAVGGTLLAAAAAIALLVLNRDDGKPPCPSAESAGPWRVEVLAGTPRCGGAAISEPVTLATGTWLETDAESQARVAVADVGELELAPETKLRLTNTGPSEHRLELDRGKIHAAVDAPPRLFVVTTPAADAVDLGCEYDLEVADDGGADLTVTDGSVSLEGGGRAVVVPTGYRAKTLPDIGPTPAVAVTTPREVFDAVVDYTRKPNAEALTKALEVTGAEGTATLVGLLPLTDREDCRRVHHRLVAISPMPFPWKETGLSCADVPTLTEAWTNLLQQTW